MLDLACGDGFYTRQIAERLGSGGFITGVDINLAYLSEASEEAPHQSGRAKIDFIAASFDLAARLLRPDGPGHSRVRPPWIAGGAFGVACILGLAIAYPLLSGGTRTISSATATRPAPQPEKFEPDSQGNERDQVPAAAGDLRGPGLAASSEQSTAEDLLRAAKALRDDQGATAASSASAQPPPQGSAPTPRRLPRRRPTPQRDLMAP